MGIEEIQTRKVYLNGKWVSTGHEIEIVNPATEQVFAKVFAIDRDHMRMALDAAEASFAAWRGRTAKERGTLLHGVADALQRRRDEIARAITLENGKPLAQSKGEVDMAEDHLRWFAEEARRSYGRTIPPQVHGKRHLVVKTPVGVVGAIAPWNFPLVLSVRKVAPALAAGCPVILKPASQTPLCAIALAECMETAGVPGGVFQLAIGNAAMIGNAFLTDPICRKISFTGSTKIGQELIRGAANQVKPLSLELGGQAPVLIFEDCDLERAVQETVIAKFRKVGWLPEYSNIYMWWFPRSNPMWGLNIPAPGNNFAPGLATSEPVSTISSNCAGRMVFAVPSAAAKKAGGCPTDAGVVRAAPARFL